MTKLMGICNLTPDSFSGDGAGGFTLAQQIQQVEKLVADGAAVIDVGAESTRPGATPLTAAQEWQRLEPLLKHLSVNPVGAIISVDTYHPENAVRALDLGVHWINDVTASEAMLLAVQPYACSLVLMHSLSVPVIPGEVLPDECDPVQVVLEWGHAQLQHAQALGIKHERVILDPGIGFGKRAAQSWQLLKDIDVFKQWNVPLLVGHSRKSYLGELCQTMEQRDAATVSVSLFLAMHDVEYLRVHQVKAHADMLTVAGKLL